MRNRSLTIICVAMIFTLALFSGDAYAAGRGGPQARAVHGVTILIDFEDEVASYTPADLDNFMNLPGYTGHDNNGSVRDYFLDVSDGLFDYTNTVTDSYFRAPEPNSYYAAGSFNDVRILVGQALQWFDQQGFDFTNFDSDGDGVIDAINVLYAGSRDSGGLHAHAASDLSLTLDGYSAVHYQVTGLRNSRPPLVTVVHENGHMLFGWPDLYPQSPGATGDLGAFCIMGGATTYGDYTDPVEPNAFFKWKAGWIVPIEFQGLTANFFLRDDINQAAIIRHPDYPQNQECYILENRQAAGRDARLPASGIAIYHLVDGNDVASNIYLVEADGGTEVQDGVSDGDVGDLWTAPHYTRFDFGSFPALTWADGTVANLHIEDISGLGMTMTFNYGFYESAVIEISSFPAGLSAPWTLTSSSGYQLDGSGDVQMDVPAGFNYQVTYGDIPLWSTPAPVLKYVGPGLSSPVVFRGTYGGSFLPISGSGLVDNQEATGVTMIDIDGDGDDDMFIANEGGQNRLLRNDGFSFVDIAPSNLAFAGNTQMAAWADADNDGDLDVFLASAAGTNVLLKQTSQSPLTFVDVTSQIANAANIGAVSSASWSDVDQDGVLDLFLARYSDTNLLYVGSTASPMNYSLGDAGFAANGSATLGARWGDFDDDGYTDLFLSASDGSGASPRLVRNNTGNLSYPGGNFWFQTNRVIDAKWADINNDQKVDLVVLRDFGTVESWLHEWVPALSRWEFVYHTLGFAGQDITAFELGDFDNDGWIDVFCDRSGLHDTIALNDGTMSEVGTLEFTSVPLGYDLHAGPGFAVASLDLNNDGGLDLFLGKGGSTNVIVLNFLMSRGNWLAVDLEGTSANTDAIGATVYVTTGGMTQIRQVAAGGGPGQGSRVLHFGLGTATSADLVRVVWDGSGSDTYLGAVSANQKISISQGAAKTLPMASLTQDIPKFTTSFDGVYPNPFNPRTSIRFELAHESNVDAAIYDLRGRKIAELASGRMVAGPHRLEWAGEDASGQRVASGTYFFRMIAGSHEFRSKLVLVK